MGVMAARCRRPIWSGSSIWMTPARLWWRGCGVITTGSVSVSSSPRLVIIGRFLADPLEGVPAEVIGYLAGQLQIADSSCVKKYARRQQTHLDHAGKIRKALKLKDFAQVEAELAVYAGRRAGVTGDSPKAIFARAVGWLRERDVLLPGVTTLARLVARERDAATGRLGESLYAATADQQRAALDALLVVPPGGRVSELERWRTGPARPAGPQMVKALHRVAAISGSGVAGGG